MKLKAALIVLVAIVVGTACGKRPVVAAPAEPGPAGQDGVGCYDEEFPPNEEYPSGGVAIYCGDDDPVILTNGADGHKYKKPKKPKHT